jgi:hypothetical protein
MLGLPTVHLPTTLSLMVAMVSDEGGEAIVMATGDPRHPPRRDSVNQSYPPLDFFTPLAPMWFSPRFPTKPHLTPGVSPCVLWPVYPYRCAFCRLSPNGSVGGSCGLLRLLLYQPG